MFPHFEEASRLSSADVVRDERKHSPLARKQRHIIRLWGAGRKWQRKIVMQSMMDVVLSLGAAGTQQWSKVAQWCFSPRLPGREVAAHALVLYFFSLAKLCQVCGMDCQVINNENKVAIPLGGTNLSSCWVEISCYSFTFWKWHGGLLEGSFTWWQSIRLWIHGCQVVWILFTLSRC